MTRRLLEPTPARRAPLLLLLCFSLFALNDLAAQDEGRTMHWREVRVEARLDQEGRLHVRERQAMVFNGDWNGGERSFDLRVGQHLDLHSLTRMEPATGVERPLVEGPLERADRYDWEEGTLRWRSRLSSDPPFRDRELVYELTYTLAPVLIAQADGGYLLQHDFAFARRAGVIERFTLDLAIDEAWTTPAAAPVRESIAPLPPGHGFPVTLPLRHVGAGAPEGVASGAPGWVRGAIAGGATGIALLLALGVRNRGIRLERLAPLTPPTEMDDAWLHEHIFHYPAEVIGAAWDRSVKDPEVAALLARLVAEGKLASHVADADDEPVLHLERRRPLTEFPPHERELLEKLFFDGSERTDTASVRDHYKKKGFDPASIIRKPIEAEVARMPGQGRSRRRWLPGLALLALGAAGALFATSAPHDASIVMASAAATAAVVACIALPVATALSRQVTGRTALAVWTVLPVAAAAALLACFALGGFEGEGRLLFYRPDAALLIALLMCLGGIGLLAYALTRPTESPERTALRRRLVSARLFFEAQLESPQPRLLDAWFPYLLAFGLGPQIDQWFESFAAEGAGGRAASSTFTTAAGGVAAQAAPASGWSGGGPQFGGGTFAGGGAGGSWSMAAAGMAAGVTAPSSGSGGGGVAASGGGGGGGW